MQELANERREHALCVYPDSFDIVIGNETEVSPTPRYNETVLSIFHSHPPGGGAQPSIADLDQLDGWSRMFPEIRAFILTPEWIVEYWLPQYDRNICPRPETTDLRDYYSDWKRSQGGLFASSGEAIATQFNQDHDTFRFYNWESREARQILKFLSTSEG